MLRALEHMRYYLGSLRQYHRLDYSKSENRAGQVEWAVGAEISTVALSASTCKYYSEFSFVATFPGPLNFLENLRNMSIGIYTNIIKIVKVGGILCTGILFCFEQQHPRQPDKFLNKIR